MLSSVTLNQKLNNEQVVVLRSLGFSDHQNVEPGLFNFSQHEIVVSEVLVLTSENTLGLLVWQVQMANLLHSVPNQPLLK